MSFSVYMNIFKNMFGFVRFVSISICGKTFSCTKMLLNGFPPIPIPGVSNGLLPGGKNISKKYFLMILYDLYEKRQKSIPT